MENRELDLEGNSEKDSKKRDIIEKRERRREKDEQCFSIWDSWVSESCNNKWDTTESCTF